MSSERLVMEDINCGTFDFEFCSCTMIHCQFLDAQRIFNLTSYLQELHSRGLANADHTTLLLNCYTKLKDVSRLDEFIKVSKPSTG